MTSAKSLALHSLINIGLFIALVVIGNDKWLEEVAVLSMAAAIFGFAAACLLIRERKATDKVIEKAYELVPDDRKHEMEEVLYQAGTCPRLQFHQGDCKESIFKLGHCDHCGLREQDYNNNGVT